MLKVNNDSLIVICVVIEGLPTDCMAKGGLTAIGDYMHGLTTRLDRCSRHRGGEPDQAPEFHAGAYFV